jgi:hypothetical protein
MADGGNGEPLAGPVEKVASRADAGSGAAYPKVLTGSWTRGEPFAATFRACSFSPSVLLCFSPACMVGQAMRRQPPGSHWSQMMTRPQRAGDDAREGASKGAPGRGSTLNRSPMSPTP